MRTPARTARGAAEEPHPGDGLRFRPTWRQALGHGLWVGLLVTGALLLTCTAAVAAPSVVDWLAGTDLERPVPRFVWVALLLPVPLGGLLGLVLGRRVGADLDAAGVRGASAAVGVATPWHRVVDVRVERRGRRTVVALPVDDGSIVRLRAPYDGDLLGRDPDFERKHFRIRHLWEIHRYGRP